MASNDDAKRALLRIGEQSAGRRRKTGTIVSVQGRHASVLLDGEGTSIVLAYRGPYEPSVGAGVTIERVPETNSWRLAGIRDNALNVVGDLPYDFERAGVGLYYPLALEALNNAAYTLGTGLTMTVYNTQFVNANGDFIYTASQSIDLTAYVPETDSRWCIVYADGTTGVLAVYAHTTTSSPDGEWPSAVNGLLDSDETAVPLLAVWLDAAQTAWLDAHKVIKRGFSYAGKRIVSIPHAVQPIAGESGLTAVTPINLTGFTSESGVTGNVIAQDDMTFIFAKHSSGVTPPDETFDSTQGYNVGSLYKTDTAIWICVDASEGVAEWVQIYPDTVDLSSPPAIGDVTPAPSIASEHIDVYSLESNGYIQVTGPVVAETITANTSIDAPQITGTNIEAAGSLTLPSAAPSSSRQLGFVNNRVQMYGRGVAQALSGRWYTQGGVRLITNTTTETVMNAATITPLPANTINIGTGVKIRISGAFVNNQGASRTFTMKLYIGGGLTVSVAVAVPAAAQPFHGEFYADFTTLGAGTGVTDGSVVTGGWVDVSTTNTRNHLARVAVNTQSAVGIGFSGVWSSYTAGTELSAYIYALTIDIHN
jgi:hypothetical protein